MTALVDSLVILVLLAVGLARVPTTSPEALPALAWFAFTTPLLARSDIARRRLPNAATLPGLAVAAGSAVVALGWGGGPDPALALGSIAVVAVGGSALARTGALGLGDVKLAAGLAGSLVLVDPGGLIALGAVAGLAGLGAALVARARRSPRGVAFGPCLLVGYWVAVGLP